MIPLHTIQPKLSYNTFALHCNWIAHFPSCNPIHEYSSAASALWGELGWEFGEKVATAANQNPGKVNLWPCVYKSAKSWQHLGSLGGRDFRTKMILWAPTEPPLIKVVMTNKQPASQKGCDTYTWMLQITNHRTIHVLVLFLVLSYYDHHCSYMLVIISADAHYCNWSWSFCKKKFEMSPFHLFLPCRPHNVQNKLKPKPTIKWISIKSTMIIVFSEERVWQRNWLWRVVVDELDFISTPSLIMDLSFTS